MSGAHSQHRTPNVPQFTDSGVPVFKQDATGWVYRWTTTPGGQYENGRCIEWNHELVPVQRHVLDYTGTRNFTSKHARGRIRPRTAKEQRRADALKARFVRASKSLTLLQQRGAILDEVLAA